MNQSLTHPTNTGVFLFERSMAIDEPQGESVDSRGWKKSPKSSQEVVISKDVCKQSKGRSCLIKHVTFNRPIWPGNHLLHLLMGSDEGHSHQRLLCTLSRPNEGFLKYGYLQIIHFHGIFPYEPSISRYPYGYGTPQLVANMGPHDSIVYGKESPLEMANSERLNEEKSHGFGVS